MPSLSELFCPRFIIILNSSTNIKAYTDKYCGTTTTKKADPKKKNACALIKKVQAEQKAAEEAEEDEDVDMDIDADNDDNNDIDPAFDDGDIDTDSDADNSDVEESNIEENY